MPNAKIEIVSETRKKINIHVPAEKVGAFLKRAYQKVSSKATIKGFRPGKIPQNMLDRFYGPEIDMECLNFLVDETYPEVMRSHNIIPISKPDFNITPIVRTGDYHYSVEVEVKPDFKLQDYQAITLQEVVAQAGADEIEKELNSIQENLAELIPVTEGETLNNGHVALIDFEGKIDDVPFEGGTSKDYMLHYGKGNFLKDFEEQMSGMKAGEQRVVHVTFPADYFQKAVAGKKAEFLVTLKTLHNKKLPPLDDELAKDVGKKDFAELKSEVEKLILESKKSNIRREYVEQIRKIILKDYTFEVPQGLVKEEAEKTKRDHQEVSDQIKFEFVLEAIAAEQKLEPLPEDIDRRLAVYAQIYRQPLPQIKKMFLTNRMLPHLISSILIDKALDFIIERAKMTR